jgi:hypothetical protein
MIMAEIVMQVISMPTFDCRDSKDEITRRLEKKELAVGFDTKNLKV